MLEGVVSRIKIFEKKKKNIFLRIVSENGTRTEKNKDGFIVV